jgi:hypothetical protein
VERLGEEAVRLLAAAGSPSSGGLGAVTSVWPGCVGEAIAGAAWPLRLSRDGTLHVATVSSTWAFELARLGDEIARRLRAVLGDAAPVVLRFAPGPVPEPSIESPQPAEGVPPPTPERLAEGRRMAAAISDPKLRDAVARAAAASLASPRSGRRFC